jgi:hypothetical protein
MDELTDVADDNYDKLLAMWSGKDNYLWPPPQKGYRLPKSKKKFHAEYDAVFDAFMKVLAEYEAMGVLKPS